MCQAAVRSKRSGLVVGSVASVDRALERRVSLVHTKVGLETARSSKRGRASSMVALEGFLSCVAAFMLGEMARPGKSSITPFALEGLLSCVDAFMLGEIA